MNDREKLVELFDNFGVYDDWYTNGEIADHLIANGVTVQRWIPVTERLPEKDGIYLTFNKKKQYEFHMFQAGKRMWQGIWEADGVTHWMPLPEPPKEDE